MAEDRAPWEKRPDESAKAFKGFTLYLEMPAALRSVDAAYRKYVGKPQESRARAAGFFKTWSVGHDWVERAAAYDAEQARAMLAEQGAAEVQEFRERTRKLAAATTSASVVLLQKALERLRGVKVEDIPLKSLPSFFRAAAVLGKYGTDAEALSIGVEEILRELADAEDEG